ncbi:Polysaccharide monooxygenase Cel61a-like protein [Hapsidospora chrysogenum ATCC 11550]|uniref:lytic cellulose monooxygenase (C4-dehydrogenating) n=1 Tax=Hapsidospora chrysogenum (strain ATCC 11550 / CBS 779.69 / DSM 880 / IAM 14645 / JCM 23072 / IMI 49137) TaxID=857340 RepID=A0A086TI40_HAPC1|nr:Polysaccharide monooxygenase Cel61a-like protein [Hapsidospora chrysogenum ATCC 11550]
MSRPLALATAALAAQVAAHGYLQSITLDGVTYEGYNYWNMENRDPNHIGWSHTTQNEGPEPDLSSPDFACRSGSEPAQSYGTVKAGGEATFVWTSDDTDRNPEGWAHTGPIATYIARCPDDDCTSADKTALQWVKIQEESVVEGTANDKGTWATDVLRQTGGAYSATIPENLAAGKYVIRSELMALHRAHLGEPEFYMQCSNIEVTGSGTDDLSGAGGVTASNLYSTSDDIFSFNLYNQNGETTWQVPGPPLYTGAAKSPANGGDEEDVDAGQQPPPTSADAPTPTPSQSEPVTEPAPTVQPDPVPTGDDDGGDDTYGGGDCQGRRPRKHKGKKAIRYRA